MKIINFTVTALLFLLVFSSQGLSQTAIVGENVTQSAAQITWLSWDEAAKKMEKEPRKMMIDIYTDWCGWCKKMDATTMKDPLIAQYVTEKYYAVKMDGEYKGDIDFGGKVYKFIADGRRGYHELPAVLMNNRMSYPTIVFLDEEFKIIQPLPGYQEARELEIILNYFGGDFYKNDVPWEKFKETYKSPASN